MIISTLDISVPTLSDSIMIDERAIHPPSQLIHITLIDGTEVKIFARDNEIRITRPQIKPQDKPFTLKMLEPTPKQTEDVCNLLIQCNDSNNVIPI